MAIWSSRSQFEQFARQKYNRDKKPSNGQYRDKPTPLNDKQARVFRRANHFAGSLKPNQVKTVPGVKYDGGPVVAWKTKTGVTHIYKNHPSTSAVGKGFDEIRADGGKTVIGAGRRFSMRDVITKKIWKNSSFKKGSTGSKGG